MSNANAATSTFVPLQEQNLTNRFLFDEVVEDKSTQQNIISIVLNRDISLLDKNETEKEFRVSPQLKSVRLDVYSVDQESTVYDTEMQGYWKNDLRKRSRYYQGIMDCSLLPAGAISYNLLNDTCIIFITIFDIFGLGKYLYTFHGWCDEEKECMLHDGATRIFLNTKGKNPQDVSPELVEFARYVVNSTDKTAAEIKSERVKRIHNRVKEVKRKEKVNVKYLREWEEKCRAEQAIKEARDAGLNEGHTENMLCLILTKVKKNKSPETIANELETDPKNIQPLYEFVQSHSDLSEEDMLEVWREYGTQQFQ